MKRILPAIDSFLGVLIVTVLATSAIYFYGDGSKKLRTSLEQRYTEWLDGFQKKLRERLRSKKNQVPAVTVRMQWNSPAGVTQWELESTKKIEGMSRRRKNERLTRILSMLEESEFFRFAAEESPGSGEPTLNVIVETDGQLFDGKVSSRSMENNMRLQLLVKLIELFAEERQSLGLAQAAKEQH